MTHVSDLHRALANLARSTLESVVQERYVNGILYFLFSILGRSQARLGSGSTSVELLLTCLQIWIAFSTNLPTAAEETSLGTKAGGGFCHDSC